MSIPSPSAPRAPSVERASELARTLTEAYDHEIAVAGGVYRTEAISAIARFMEALEKIDPGFAVAFQALLYKRPLIEPKRWFQHVLLERAFCFCAGVAACAFFLIVTLLLVEYAPK